MDARKKRKRILTVGAVLMALALFTYIATLDESDPEALPEATGQFEPGLE